ncbi:MAG: ATP-binding protein [Syntrophobacter sp.]
MSPAQKTRAKLRLRLVVALPALLSLFMVLSAALAAFLFPGALAPAEFTEGGLHQVLIRSMSVMTALAFIGSLAAALYISRRLNTFIMKLDSTIRPEPSFETEFEASSEIGALGVMLDRVSLTLGKFVNDSYIIDNLPEAVLLVGPDGTILRMNSNASRLLGAAPGEGTGKNLRDFIPYTPMSRSFYLLIDEAHKGFPVPPKTVHFSVRENENRRYWVSLHPVRKERRLPTEVSISIKDHASIAAVRNQIRRIEQLAALGSMASTVAHEVRNPLGAIRTFTELIQEGIPEDDTKAGYVRQILQQIRRLDRLVEDALAFSRDPVISVKDVDLPELLSMTVALARFKFTGKVPAVSEDYKPGIPAIRGDPEKLSQAFLNLIVNAFEACGEGGWIAVGACLADDGPKNGRTVRVSIADGGTGISPEARERLFEPFFTTKPSGTGLGLPTAQSILVAHGGLIEVDSEPGKGATFQVLLPEKHHFCDPQIDDRWSDAGHA